MNISQAIKESISYSEVARKLGYKYINGTVSTKVKKLVIDSNCDISHFRKRGRRYKYERIKKTCPVCNNIFEVQKGHKREKQTCSYACSNTYFRTGPDNGGWKEEAYRTTCFYYHEKKCVICPEENIVEVHHLDGNKKNNKPSNLIPLCSTHHQYWHSHFRYLIEEKVLSYVDSWIEKRRFA